MEKASNARIKSLNCIQLLKSHNIAVFKKKSAGKDKAQTIGTENTWKDNSP